MYKVIMCIASCKAFCVYIIFIISCIFNCAPLLALALLLLLLQLSVHKQSKVK
jgi:hypothetical protein